MATTFTIKASPGTDVWRKPPTTDIFNAPTASPLPPGTTATAPLASLASARVSFRLPAAPRLLQYDQAGLLLSLRARGATHPFSAPSPPKWIKAGVEIYQGTPRAATVACDAWADWSLAPVTTTTTTTTTPEAGGEGGSGDEEEGRWVTVAVESGTDELGRSLWVYQVVGGGDRIPLREVCWPFGGGDGGDGWEVRVEAYACRPSKEAAEELEVEFRGFEVKWT